jgi:hypothetical protein
VRARERIDRVDEIDPVSGDLLIHVAATLEKQLWMIRTQTTESGAAAADPVDRTQDANGRGGS